MKRINVVHPRYSNKAHYLASWQNRPRSVQNQNFSVEMSDSEQIVLYTPSFNRYDVICFRPANKTHPSLHWDCILFFVECNQSENRVQRKPQNAESHERGHRRKQAWRSRWTRKPGPKPLEKPRGAANLQSSQKLEISRACETKLGCVLSFLENAITARLLTKRYNKDKYPNNMLHLLIHLWLFLLLLYLFLCNPFFCWRTKILISGT